MIKASANALWIAGVAGGLQGRATATSDSQQHIARLLRSDDCRLALWYGAKNPEQTEALARLLAATRQKTLDECHHRPNLKTFKQDLLAQ